MIPRTDYGNTSKTLHKGLALIIGATLAADGAVADMQVYDGVDTNGQQKLHIEAYTANTAHIVPAGPILCEEGIHVVVNAATSKWTLQYIPITRKQLEEIKLRGPASIGQGTPASSSQRGAPPPPPF